MINPPTELGHYEIIPERLNVSPDCNVMQFAYKNFPFRSITAYDVLSILLLLISSHEIVVGDNSNKSFHTNRESKDNNLLVICFGEMLIDFVPTVGGVSLVDAPAFEKAPGGAPANVAVGISKLGGSSAFVGKVQFNISTLWII